MRLCVFEHHLNNVLLEKGIVGTLMADDGGNLCNYLMGRWLVKCFSFILYMLAWVGCQGKALTCEQRAGYYASVCFVCRILDLVTGRRVPHGVWQRREEWLADGHSPVSPFPQCQVLTGEHRDIVAVLLFSGGSGGGQREPDTLSGPGASQGLGWAQWQRWQQGGNSDCSLRSVTIMTMLTQ